MAIHHVLIAFFLTTGISYYLLSLSECIHIACHFGRNLLRSGGPFRNWRRTCRPQRDGRAQKGHAGTDLEDLYKVMSTYFSKLHQPMCGTDFTLVHGYPNLLTTYKLTIITLWCCSGNYIELSYTSSLVRILEFSVWHTWNHDIHTT